MLVKKSSIEQNKALVNNNANDILSAWTALEVLTPQAFAYQEDLADGNEKFIVQIKEGELPWEGNPKVLKPDTKVFYQVVLGTIDLKKAVTSLLEVYTDDQSERIAEKEAILAVAIVDKDGFLIKDATAVSISSFAWGINKALNKELTNLEAWVSVEESYISELEKLFRRYGEDGKSLPLDISIIEAAYNELLAMFELPKYLAMKTFFAVRCYEPIRSLQPPESLLLNSFYIKDLAGAKSLFSKGNATFNLQRYLGVKKPEKQFDLLNNTSKLEEVISPSFMPPARWPSANYHSLILMQQAAVNLSFKELKEEGIIAVNGPPGTGKSTLLRDVVAELVTQRAEVMSTFDDPADAFTHAGQKIKVGQGWLQPYKLDSNLKGFEMVIASSNNKAVENISAELPAIEAIGNCVNLSYFRALSDALLKRKSWGLIAAILGNSTNRRRFQQSFWWDKEVGLSTYLAEASGTPQIIEVVDRKSGEVLERRRPKIIIESEAPSSHEEALKRWRKVREDFLSKLKESKSKISELEQLRSTITLLPELIKEELESLDVFNKAVKKEKAAREKVVRAKAVLLITQGKLEDVENQLARHKKVKPNLLAWTFRTENSKTWRVKRKDLTAVLNEMKEILKENNDVVLFAESYLANCEVSLYKSRVRHAEKSLVSANAQNKVNSYQEKYGKHIIDEKFFSSLREQVHTTSPWCCETIQSIRSEVFIAAINLHKAFIDAAAKPLRNNLGMLMGIFSGHAFNSEFLPDIWSSLFLVVPSLSTTFSSVERMFKGLPPDSLGWLLVDEAGQAVPQAAVGAFMRTKRAIIVGDPLQIEPIVALPPKLTRGMCSYLNVNPDLFNAPEASVQTIADMATPYFTEIQSKYGSRYVGVPLLVHRRCSEPMFSISNNIAYERLMVHAKHCKNSSIQDCLGNSCWINVEGESKDKWCPQEGEMVLRMLRRLKERGIEPDLYIVTPFNVVARNLRTIIKNSKVLHSWVKDERSWLLERVGTVHTVQGREAEAVIFVLGASIQNQAGARIWAGSKPNLLNVAVTRAKEVMYVIGNRQLWQNAGLFKELADKLEVREF